VRRKCLHRPHLEGHHTMSEGEGKSGEAISGFFGVRKGDGPQSELLQPFGGGPRTPRQGGEGGPGGYTGDRRLRAPCSIKVLATKKIRLQQRFRIGEAALREAATSNH